MRAAGAGAYLVALLAAASGCLEAGAVVCADGRICPAGLVCSEANHRCVSQEQLDACAGKEELATCEVSGGGAGECRAGACLFSICGDGLVEGAETCDGDDLGEGSDCIDLGYYDPQPLSCDASCRHDVSACTGGRCGDEVINGPELCDGPPPDLQCVDLGYGVGALPACTARCEPDTALCHRIGVERLSLPAADAARDLTGSGPDDVYAIARRPDGNGGPLFRNGGITWLRIFDDAYSVWSLGRDDVYATVRREDQITLQHFDGSGWSVIEGVTPTEDQRVRAGGPDDIDLVGGTAPSVHWDGAGWSHTSGLPVGDVVDLWSAAGVSYLVMNVGPDNQLYRSDGGDWQLVDPGLLEVTAVWGSDADAVWIGGGRDLALWSGEEWTVFPDALPIGGDIVSLSGLAEDDLFVVTIEDLGVGGGNALLGRLAHFDGASWSPVTELPGVHEVWAGSREAVYLSGNPGTTFRYHGSLWRPDLVLGLGPGHAPAGFVLRDGEVFAAVNFTAFSDNGLVYRFDGTSWDEGASVSSSPLNGVFLSGSAVHAVGDAGLFRLGGGTTWTQVDVAGGPEPVLRGGWSNGPEARFVVGENLFHDLGSGWTETDRIGPCLIGMTAVWGSSASDVFAVGGCGLIMHFDGEKWSAMDSGSENGLTAVWGRGAGDVYAVGVAGTVLRYDGGAWSAMPELPIPADLSAISGSEGELFATGSQGLVFHFDGSAWSQLEPEAVVDTMIEVTADKHEMVFMSVFGTDLSLLRLLRTAGWRAP